MEGDLQRFLEELRGRLAVSEVVGQKVKLTHKGREHTGLCPFHHEKTPSFTVNDIKGFYHCFGCGAHGDIVKFEMQANGLPFMDALEKLARQAGLTVPKFSSARTAEVEKKQSLYTIMELACAFYERELYLREGAQGLEYFHRRGLDEALIKKFRLGYAPSNNALKAYLLSKGVHENDMMELGLVVLPEDRSRSSHDFFRDRVMIPIRDRRGRVIAFGGRLMNDGQPKYLNSPETPVFNKRQMLYNINFARDNGFKSRQFIICEGYMDVIALDKFGFDYAAAPMGTALTEEQIMQAWNIVPEPILCFDGDSAGIKAALRSVDRALPILKAGYSLRFIFLPDKMDPDEFLRANGREAFQNLMNKTIPLVQLLWEKNVKNAPADTPERKALIEKNLMTEVQRINDPKVRAYYTQEMQKRIYENLGRGTLQRLSRHDTSSSKRTGRSTVKPPLKDVDLRFILAAMLTFPNLIEIYEERLMMFDISKFDGFALLQHIIELFHTHENLDSKTLYQLLVSDGFETSLQKLWEIKMLQNQKPDIRDLRRQINALMVAVQIKQLDQDILALKLKLGQDGVAEEDYAQYLQLKNERDKLIMDNESA